MALELNNALYTSKGIDLASVNKVSAEILQSAQKSTPQVQSIDYSKFNRQTLGIDLYSNRTNTDLQRQIALTQAGLYTQAVNVAKLNATAAANLYSAQNVQRNVGLTQSAQVNEYIAPVEAKEIQQSIKLFQTSDKHSNSKNGFNPFMAKSEKQD